jgi:hypothetical protein
MPGYFAFASVAWWQGKWTKRLFCKSGQRTEKTPASPPGGRIIPIVHIPNSFPLSLIDIPFMSKS